MGVFEIGPVSPQELRTPPPHPRPQQFRTPGLHLGLFLPLQSRPCSWTPHPTML